jgi:uncharacterized membrane protein YhaH (DUF805 family)
MRDLSPIYWAIRPLKRYANFSGRAPRAEYWWFWLGYVLLDVVLQILVRISPLFGLLGFLYLGLIIPMVAVGVRRIHDIDRTGWWLAAPLVPYSIALVWIFPALMRSPNNLDAFFVAGPSMIFMLIAVALAVVVFIFTVAPGTKGSNRFGPDPYDEDNLQEVFA